MVSMVQTVPMFVDTAKMTELVTNIVDSVLWMCRGICRYHVYTDR